MGSRPDGTGRIGFLVIPLGFISVQRQSKDEAMLEICHDGWNPSHLFLSAYRDLTNPLRLTHSLTAVYATVRD